MAGIDIIERYKYEGKEYDKLSQIKEIVENKIGKIIEDRCCAIPPKIRIKIFEAIIYNKTDLVDALSEFVYIEDEDGEGTNINILDYEPPPFG